MAHHDDGTAIGQNFLERRKCAADAGVVGYLAVLIQRNVEVYTYNGLLAIEIKFVLYCDCYMLIDFGESVLACRACLAVAALKWRQMEVNLHSWHLGARAVQV